MHRRTPAQRFAVLCVLPLAAGVLGVVGCSLGMSGCLPGDDTETCCLKEFPGQYERCMGVTPRGGTPKGGTTPKQRPSPGPEEGPQPGPGPVPPLLPKDPRKREEACREYYDRCIERGGEYEKRGMFGRTICQSCYVTCRAEGYWPDQVNDLPCLGG